MDTDRLAAGLHPLERKVLPLLAKTNSFSVIMKEAGLKDLEVMRALQWLQNKKIIGLNKEFREMVSLDTNGDKYKNHGLPERNFLKALEGKTALSEIAKKTGLEREEIGISIGALKQKAAINVGKEGSEPAAEITEQGKALLKKEWLEEKFLKKTFPVDVKSLSPEEKFALEALKKRREIVKVSVVKEVIPHLTDIGKKLIKSGVKSENVIESLTPEMLKSSTWKNKKFRHYDVSINVPKISGGKRHFVPQAIEYIKSIWLDLGFREMTGNYVQTAFWDLDALFVPQDHPARDMQDTFYIKDPSEGKIPAELSKKVKASHENGWTTGSKGWQYEWSEKEAKRLMMITHDTFLSAKTLASTKKEDLPIKTFQIMRVFRNESLSWKSLFEFHQVGGIVVDPNANFKHLKGYLKQFFAKMGFPDVRIRPAHFPYTEPSAEIDVWHPAKKQWVELGGCGIFRPEMVKPLLGFECPVLAWGIGLERTIMEYYGFQDVRDVYRNDLRQLRESKLWMK